METQNAKVLMKTNLPLPVFLRGKVRDTYDLDSHLLVIVTDRISAFDVVLPNGIPNKGHVLNRLSSFWFRKTADIIPNHMAEAVDDVHCIDSYLPENQKFTCPPYLRGRSMVVKKVKRIPVECVVRGYISGSAWTEYKENGTVSGNAMPEGLVESQELEKPIFTPTTKADKGHDEPIGMEDIVKAIGKPLADEMEEKSLDLYNYGREYARERGIIIADTKFEFGIDNNRLILIDEVLTPDSSRFWDAELYEPGKSQPSFDKQPVRDWLEESGWNKEPPGPVLPDDIVEATSKRYMQAYEKITGRQLAFLGDND
ncbi:MAG TPA: phosphoribosylaminoimidazolesuccinocarboxamide synthase [Dehalococcoidia bacterium]|nr:phosphoribosylaminoimidazolesuccinocarboxamide synthase [Dehalococcoidia bacterium]